MTTETSRGRPVGSGTAAGPAVRGDPVALIFPGQGSQSPGMGQLIYERSREARLAFEEASDITRIDLARVCFEGSAEELAETRATQPAVLTTSVAFLRAMRERLGEVGRAIRPRVMGGHSLGLFSAAVASEAISFRDSLLVILERARLMSTFNEQRPVGMASIIGLTHDAVAEICRDATVSPADRVDIANHNMDTHLVISGDLSALERADWRSSATVTGIAFIAGGTTWAPWTSRLTQSASSPGVLPTRLMEDRLRFVQRNGMR